MNPPQEVPAANAAPGTPIQLTVFTGSWPSLPNGGTFSPTTSSLITGPTEAALVDAQYLLADVRRLGDLIESTGKTLTTIYITHGHADHYLGLGPLLERFPTARCVAKPDVVDYMTATMDYQRTAWTHWFGAECVAFGPLPEALSESHFTVDGSVLDIVEVGQADIAPTTVVHIPDLATVIAGDAVYNGIHPMLGLSSPQEWEKWIDSIDQIERLNPTTIVAGHKQPEAPDQPAQVLIDTTRGYIRDFISTTATSDGPEEVVATMRKLYPRHGNPWTLTYSAQSYFSRIAS